MHAHGPGRNLACLAISYPVDEVRRDRAHDIGQPGSFSGTACASMHVLPCHHGTVKLGQWHDSGQHDQQGRPCTRHQALLSNPSAEIARSKSRQGQLQQPHCTDHPPTPHAPQAPALTQHAAPQLTPSQIEPWPCRGMRSRSAFPRDAKVEAATLKRFKTCRPAGSLVLCNTRSNRDTPVWDASLCCHRISCLLPEKITDDGATLWVSMTAAV